MHGIGGILRSPSCQCVNEEDVDAASPVHEDFGPVESTDDWVKHQGKFSWMRNVVRVVRSIEGDGGVRAIQVLCDGGHGCVDFSARELLSTFCISSAEDHVNSLCLGRLEG